LDCRRVQRIQTCSRGDRSGLGYKAVDGKERCGKTQKRCSSEAGDIQGALKLSGADTESKIQAQQYGSIELVLYSEMHTDRIAHAIVARAKCNMGLLQCLLKITPVP
jgi:hypothetical protein